MTEAARRIEGADELEHDERAALKADVDRVRGVLAGDVAADGARAVAVFACQDEDLLEVVALRHPLDSRVVLDRTPYVEPLVHEGAAERWCVLLVNRKRRAPVHRRRRGAGGDRPDRGRRPQPARPGRLVAGQLPAQRGEGEARPPQHAAEVTFALYKRQGFDRLLVGGPRSWSASSRAGCTPTCATAWGRVSCDVEHSTLEEVRGAPPSRSSARPPRRARGAGPAGQGRRPRRPRRRRHAARARRAQRRPGGDAADRRGFSAPGSATTTGCCTPPTLPGAASGRRRGREGDREGDRAVRRP